MSGIRDKVAVVGMGCSRFGERWEANPDDLVCEAFEEAIEDSGLGRDDIDAAWLGSALDAFNIGPSGIPLAVMLRLPFIPVTRVENMCASGTEAFRGAVYAVASGAADYALAVGVEKLKDTGYGGLPQRTRGVLNDLHLPNLSAPGMFAQLASGYAAAHGLDEATIKRAMAHVSVKSHRNASVNPKAHLRNVLDLEQVVDAPMVADPIGLYDCCGVSDGAAAAIVTTVDRARELKDAGVVVKSLQLAVSNGYEAGAGVWDGAHIKTTRIASSRAYEEAGIEDPRREVDLIEVHDCFSITELVTMEDLGLSDPGCAPKDILDGCYDRDGRIPCQIDGGLKCFGHPVGASGLRMLYEVYKQLRGEAGERQLAAPATGLTHNLGGFPQQNVCSITILGIGS